MAQKMLIDATHAEETRVVVADGTRLEEFDFESITKRQIAGNIYLAKVMRVEPSLQAAFVDYGGNRHGFLAFSEIHPDYYQIPKAERDLLIASMARETAENDADTGCKQRDKKHRSRDAKTDAKDDNGRRRGSRRGGRHKRSGPRGRDVRRSRDGSIIEREFRISGGMKVRLLREDDGSGIEQEFKLSDGIRVQLMQDPSALAAQGAAETAKPAKRRKQKFTLSDGTPVQLLADTPAGETGKFVAMATDLDDKLSASAEEIADIPDEVGGDDSRDDVMSVRKPRLRDYKIQDVIKKKQILLIQVVKEERGNKGAAVTTYMSLAGRYCVLMPNTARGGGISRKITHLSDRKKLKEIASGMEVPKGMGLIIRTAGAQRTETEIKRDYEYLLRQWDAVRNFTMQSYAPALVYEEGNLIKRSIRDLYTNDIDEILVEGEDGYREAHDYMRMLMPSHEKNVKHYRDQTPLFVRYQIENQLAGMFNPIVQLKSGGYIVIGVTEALVAIDVNSGRSTRAGSIEDTAVNTNLEAADEVARQLRLRDLAGLIVIDFIDMDRSSNNRAVEKRMKERLATDRARLQIGRISSFGLMEMSRQRLRPGMLEATTTECPHCHGSGLVRSDESLALTILRDVEEEGVKGRFAAITAKAPVSIANFLLNHKRDRIAGIENRYNMRIMIEGDPHLIQPNYTLEKLKEDEAPASLRRAAAPSAIIQEASYYSDDENPGTPDTATGNTQFYSENDHRKQEEERPEDRSRGRGRRGGRNQKKSADTEALRVINLDEHDQSSDATPFNYGSKKDIASSDSGQSFRKGRKGQRNDRKRAERGKLGNREMAEAAATSMLSGRDALDDAMSELFMISSAENERQDEKQQASKQKTERKRKRSNLKSQADVNTTEKQHIPSSVETNADAFRGDADATNGKNNISTENQIAEITVEQGLTATEKSAGTAIQSEAPVSAKPSATPDPLSVKAAPTPPRNEPKKRGWWSRKKAT